MGESLVGSSRRGGSAADQPRRRSPRAGKALFLVALVALLGSISASAAGSKDFRFSGVVTRVVDGDTLDVRGSGSRIRVRVLGIDTPERGECYFGPASARARSLAL